MLLNARVKVCVRVRVRTRDVQSFVWEAVVVSVTANRSNLGRITCLKFI